MITKYLDGLPQIFNLLVKLALCVIIGKNLAKYKRTPHFNDGGGHLEDGVCIEDGGEGLVNLVLDLCCPVNDDDKDDDGDDDDGDDKADDDDDGVVDLVLDLGRQSTCQPSPCGRPSPG